MTAELLELERLEAIHEGFVARAQSLSDDARPVLSLAASLVVLLHRFLRPDRQLIGSPPPEPVRRRLPPDRPGITKAFHILRPPRQYICPRCHLVWEENNDQKVYAIVNTYEDGSPAEVFAETGKVGSTAHGAIDAWAIVTSLLLQHGIRLPTFIGKLIGIRFGAGGMTTDPKYRFVSSPVDAVARWMRDTWAPDAETTPRV